MKLEGTFKAHFDHTGSRVTARQCFLRTSSYVSQLVEPRFKYRDVLSGGRSSAAHATFVRGRYARCTGRSSRFFKNWLLVGCFVGPRAFRFSDLSLSF